MKGFKNYTPQYERFYGEEKRRFKIENVSLYHGIPGSLDVYAKLIRENHLEMEKVFFQFIVKALWLFRRFTYCGHRRNNLNVGNGQLMDGSFGYFIRRFTGIEPKVFIGAYNISLKIITYIDDWFPNFDESDIFTEVYEYPYKYMNFGCLGLVYKMDERLDLLDYGEEHKMIYADFIDYVINYVYCYNEEYGKKYILGRTLNHNAPFNITKYEERKPKTRHNRRRKKR